MFRDDADPDIVAHAQLRFGDQLIMLASAVDSDWATGAPLKIVRQAGGNTQTLYVLIDDVDGHAERARAAGADIFMEPRPGLWRRGYGARDPEGNAWSLGSYNPLAT